MTARLSHLLLFILISPWKLVCFGTFTPVRVGQCFLNLRALLSFTNSKAVTKHLITNGGADAMTQETAEWANRPNNLSVKRGIVFEY
jgi:hypothetical protein